MRFTKYSPETVSCSKAVTVIDLLEKYDQARNVVMTWSISVGLSFISTNDSVPSNWNATEWLSAPPLDTSNQVTIPENWLGLSNEGGGSDIERNSKMAGWLDNLYVRYQYTISDLIPVDFGPLPTPNKNHHLQPIPICQHAPIPSGLWHDLAVAFNGDAAGVLV
jgi:hypothetical protein